MTLKRQMKNPIDGHRIFLMVILCLFGLSLVASRQKPRKKQSASDRRVYLLHADQLSYDRYGRLPDAQILKGNVSFRHKGAILTCDSAYFFETSNSFEAFGHVKLRQGDTLTLIGDYAHYDGNEQMVRVRRNVVLTHRATKLFTDSLDYDRLYNLGYFFEGGKMIDKNNVLTSDWGEYHTDTRQSMFQYDVHLKNKKFLMNTDTLYYDTYTKIAHAVGPSTITSGKTVIKTEDGYYDTNKERARLFARSTLVNKQKEITADSLFHNDKTGISEGFSNVVYKDRENKNQMYCDYFWYNEKTGKAIATKRAMLVDCSQKDTLYMHADSMKMYTYNIDTDSVWRKIHCFDKVRIYRRDMQAVCDSLVYDTKDSLMVMYKDPIAWSDNRQMLGERIDIYMNDSTVDSVHIVGQALSVEQVDKEDHYNQIASKEMKGYFQNGEICRTVAKGNVQCTFYPLEKDSSLSVVNYMETDEMRMFMKDRKLDKIWTPKVEGTWYPLIQIPPAVQRLNNFAWFEDIRPKSKEDIFVWRGKAAGMEMKKQKRHSAPLQKISDLVDGKGNGVSLNPSGGPIVETDKPE